MDILQILELIAVITGIGFITLMIYQNIWCWPVGIVSSMASVFLFFGSKLYMESILYIFYIGIGIYGWTKWNQQKSGVKLVATRGINYHILAICACALLSATIGWISSTYTDADRPYADASSTMFSFVASYMEAHRILSSWIFWIVINLFTIWLYMDKELTLYAGMMVLYFLLSVAGFLQWKKDYDKQLNASKPLELSKT